MSKFCIYVGTPFTSSCPATMRYRGEISMAYAAKLFERGRLAISPLGVSNYKLAYFSNELPPDWATWGELCIKLLNACDEMHLIKLPGWQDSVGLAEEIAYCRANNKPIVHIELSEALEFIGGY